MTTLTKKPAKTPPEIEAIRHGYHWVLAQKLQNELELTDSIFASFLGVSSKTITRLRKSQKNLDRVASDRLYRIRRVIDHAADVFESRELGLQWLTKEQVGLGYKIPLELLDTQPGFELVEDLLGRIDYGVYS